VLVLGLCACSHARVGVRTDDLIPHIAELGADGTAKLATTVDDGGSRSAGDPVTVTLDQPVRFQGRSTSLVLLLAGCPPFQGGVPCPIKRHMDDLVYLGSRGGFRTGKDDLPPKGPPPTDGMHEFRIAVGTLSLVSFGGMGLCIAYCDSSRAEKSVALGGSGLVLGILWLLTSGNVHD
jgi:hypothetical protein